MPWTNTSSLQTSCWAYRVEIKPGIIHWRHHSAMTRRSNCRKFIHCRSSGRAQPPLESSSCSNSSRGKWLAVLSNELWSCKWLWDVCTTTFCKCHHTGERLVKVYLKAATAKPIDKHSHRFLEECAFLLLVSFLFLFFWQMADPLMKWLKNCVNYCFLRGLS